ncbi:DUF4174 domain-containing protein [Halochromatium sp.]
MIQRLQSFRLSLGLAIGLGAASPVTPAESANQGVNRPLEALEALRWQHRIIIVDAQSPEASQQLKAAQPAIAERDILWFVRHQGRLQTNVSRPLDETLTEELQQRYFDRSDASVFLIGKDGGLKATADHLDLPTLFARIDAMPMRRREMEAAQ